MSLAQVLFLTGARSTLPSQKIKIRAVSFVGYRRNSTEEQTETSQPRQADSINNYGVKNELIRVHEDFIDIGFTGTTVYGRDGFAELIKFVKSRQVDIVVVESLDRFSRNMGDAMKYYDLLTYHNVELHDTKHGRLDRAHVMILAYLASEGRDQLLQVMDGGRRNSAASGKQMGPPIYGYRRHPSIAGARLIVSERKEVLQEIFEDAAAGVGTRVIARKLNDRNEPSPRECALIDNMRPMPNKRLHWRDREILHLIKNPLVTGLILYGRTAIVRDLETREIVKREWRHADDIARGEAPDMKIIDPELWLRANCAVRDRAFGRGSERTRAQVHLLTPIITCGDCGSRMHVLGAYDKKVYRCTEACAPSKGCATVRSLRADWVERAVLVAVRDHAFEEKDNALFRERLRAACDEQNAAQKRELKRVRAEIARVDATLDNSMMQSFSAGLCGERVERFRRQQEEKIAQLQIQETRLLKKLDPSHGMDRLNGLAKAMDMLIDSVPFKPTNSDEQKLAVAFRRLVPSVVIEPPDQDGRRTIRVTIDRFGVFDERYTEVLAPPEVVSIAIDTTKELKRENAERQVAHDQAVAAAADLHLYDVPDAIWDEIAPCVRDKKLLRTIEPKTLVDGMLCLSKTGGALARPPANFGDPEIFRKGMKRIIYTGEWDEIVALLKERYPDALEGADLFRFQSTTWKRRDEHSKPLRKASEMDRRELETLINASDDEQEIRRLRVALAFLNNRVQRLTAADLGLNPKHVSAITVTYRRLGAYALLSKEPPSILDKKRRLNPAQRRELLRIARSGINPENNEAIRYVDLIRHCKERFGVTYCVSGMVSIMRQENINLKEATKAAHAKRRKQVSASSLP